MQHSIASVHACVMYQTKRAVKQNIPALKCGEYRQGVRNVSLRRISHFSGKRPSLLRKHVNID